MLKFYFNGSPNPTKVALFLEEAGIAYEPVAVDTRKGDQFKPEYLAVNPNGKVPAIVDGDVTVFDSNAILLYLAEKTGKFLPQHAGQPRRAAVLADVRRHRRRAVLGPGRALQALRAGEDRLRPQPLPVRGAAPLRHPQRPPRQAPLHGRQHLHHRRHGRVGLGAHGAVHHGRGRVAKYPNVKRLVDEISARPAAAKAIALKDKFKFKAEMDDEARGNMFKHLKVKAA